MKPTLLFGAAALLLVAGCNESGTRPDTPLEITHITPTGQPVYYSGMMEPLRAAVFDEAKLAEYWNQAFPDGDPATEPPKVDFSREFVVVAAAGERSSGGNEIEVTHANGEGRAVEVVILTTTPGKNCVVTLATTRPVDFVKITRPTSGATPVTFVERTTSLNCNP